jgi:hypothetical protein
MTYNNDAKVDEFWDLKNEKKRYTLGNIVVQGNKKALNGSNHHSELDLKLFIGWPNSKEKMLCGPQFIRKSFCGPHFTRKALKISYI